MGAAAWTRSRTTKGILLIVTLLNLVCFASSLLDKSELKYLMEKNPKLKLNIEKLKALQKSATSSSDNFGEYLKYVDPMITLMKKLQRDLPGDFPSADALLDKIKVFLEETHTRNAKQNKQLNEIEKLINHYEELKDEF